MDVWLKIDRPINAEADLPLKSQAPSDVEKQYCEKNWGDLVLWVNRENDSFGCIRLNRSISMTLSELALIELEETKPAKGNGYVGLSFLSKDGTHLGGFLSNRYSNNALNWLNEVQPILANALGVESGYSDRGYDA